MNLVKRKKRLKNFLYIVFEILFILALLSGLINWFRVFSYDKPILAYEVESDNIDELYTYYGLGYKIITKTSVNSITNKTEYEIGNYYVLGFLVYTFD